MTVMELSGGGMDHAFDPTYRLRCLVAVEVAAPLVGLLARQAAQASARVIWYESLALSAQARALPVADCDWEQEAKEKTEYANQPISEKKADDSTGFFFLFVFWILVSIAEDALRILRL
jgi:hypothetical protein